MAKTGEIAIPVVLTIDKFGRITLPKEIRQKLGSKELTAEVRGGKLLLAPAPSWDDMTGTFPNLDMEDFKKQHDEWWER